MRRSDYDRYNRRYHYHTINDERNRDRRGYFTPARLRRDTSRDEQPSIYDAESDDYDAHPYFNRKRRMNHHRDRNYLQEMGHSMKQAWDEWAKDGARVDNPSREDTYYPTEYSRGGGGYNNAWEHEQRTPPQRRYIYENYNEPDMEYTGYEPYETEFFGNDRQRGMHWRSRQNHGKYAFKYRRRK